MRRFVQREAHLVTTTISGIDQRGTSLAHGLM